jgi:hypothetical protein
VRIEQTRWRDSVLRLLANFFQPSFKDAKRFGEENCFIIDGP